MEAQKKMQTEEIAGYLNRIFHSNPYEEEALLKHNTEKLVKKHDVADRKHRHITKLIEKHFQQEPDLAARINISSDYNLFNNTFGTPSVFLPVRNASMRNDLSSNLRNNPLFSDYEDISDLEKAAGTDFARNEPTSFPALYLYRLSTYAQENLGKLASSLNKEIQANHKRLDAGFEKEQKAYTETIDKINNYLGEKATIILRHNWEGEVNYEEPKLLLINKSGMDAPKQEASALLDFLKNRHKAFEINSVPEDISITLESKGLGDEICYSIPIQLNGKKGMQFKFNYYFQESRAQQNIALFSCYVTKDFDDYQQVFTKIMSEYLVQKLSN